MLHKVEVEVVEESPGAFKATARLRMTAPTCNGALEFTAYGPTREIAEERARAQAERSVRASLGLGGERC